MRFLPATRKWQKRTKLGSRFKRIHSKQIPKDESF